MKIISTVAYALITGLLLNSSVIAQDINLEDYGDPAIISFHADRANVTTDSSGQRITFNGASTLATLTSQVHKHNERFFSAFPISELPESWNSCNNMKFENRLFHNDGVNSAVTFSSGPAGHNEHGHLSTAPLITQTSEILATVGGDEGLLVMMLDDAVFEGGNLSFRVRQPIKMRPVSDGVYQEVAVSTECFIGVAGVAIALIPVIVDATNQ
jgi:hypothetical protein